MANTLSAVLRLMEMSETRDTRGRDVRELQFPLFAPSTRWRRNSTTIRGKAHEKQEFDWRSGILGCQHRRAEGDYIVEPRGQHHLYGAVVCGTGSDSPPEMKTTRATSTSASM